MTHPHIRQPFGLFGRALTLLLLTALVTACSEGGGSGQQEPPPSPVTVTEVETTDATHYGEYAGRLQGATEVEIRARVSGILEERRYDEGEAVEAGQTLFQIEPGPYEDALNSAKADLADARAQSIQAESEWERVSGLYERDAVSERERDQTRAQNEAAQARVTAAQSSVSNAERELRYTRVEAPVNGITGIEAVTEGNLVDTGTLLTYVTQHDPVHVYFALPESDAVAQRVARDARKSEGDDARREANIVYRDGSLYEREGVVDFSDRRIDPMTGSVQMRASFPNPDGELIPGQFVRVRLALKDYNDAILIDPTAVSEGAQGPQVFIVQDNAAALKPVELGPVIDGQQLILSGLEAGAQLVTNGHVALGDGAPVNVTNASDEEG